MMRPTLGTALLVVLAFSTSSGLVAQSPKPAFEVASVKKRDQPTTSLSQLGNVRRGGVFRSTSITVALLIRFAYGVRDFQIVGGPEWIREDPFEIDAKAAGDAGDVPIEQVRLMVQSLLEDRFRLAVHTESREMPYVALLPARSDGRPGPNLHRIDEDGDCGSLEVRATQKANAPSGTTMQSGGCGPMSVVAEFASLPMGVPVIDATGISRRPHPGELLPGRRELEPLARLFHHQSAREAAQVGQSRVDPASDRLVHTCSHEFGFGHVAVGKEDDRIGGCRSVDRIEGDREGRRGPAVTPFRSGQFGVHLVLGIGLC
jgi:uncharacterized protein (TIGR03435 family)